ncbi:MAG: flagellar biosynthesis protein FlhB [Bacillota bacterium]
MEPRFIINLQLFADDKSEEATPRKRQEVRKKGQTIRSGDLNAAVGLLAVVGLMLWNRNIFIDQTTQMVTAFLGQELHQQIDAGGLMAIAWQGTGYYMRLVGPVFLAAAVAGVTVNLAQSGFIFAPSVLQPNFSYLNPLQGLQRIFSRKSLVELVKSLAKVTLVALVSYSIVRSRVDKLLFLMDTDVSQIFATVADVVLKLALNVIIVFLIIGVLDYIFQRMEYNRRIMMSKQEVKEEMRQTEGDPKIRARQREKQRELSRQRMMQQVPEATVVITNPTHLAIALSYKEGEMPAPQVVAKGADLIAQRIIEIARENNVPVVENQPVARFIYQNVEIGQDIPAELYQAIAEILALIYKTKNKAGAY